MVTGPGSDTAAREERLAALIIRGLSGHHLDGFLPGSPGRNREAVAHAVASKHGWYVSDVWGQVTRDGIGEWPEALAAFRNHVRNASMFVPWAEVLAVIARGCADGYRERYEAAHRSWLAAVHEARKDDRPGDSRPMAWVDPSPMHEAAAALIRHGCDAAEVQGELFSLGEIA